jgi:transcriptional regulator with XRE-family HTH domain
MNKVLITRKIKAQMALKGLTQEEIAKIIGRSTSEFNKDIRFYKTSMLNIKDAIGMCKALDVSLDYIFMED